MQEQCYVEVFLKYSLKSYDTSAQNSKMMVVVVIVGFTQKDPNTTHAHTQAGW